MEAFLLTSTTIVDVAAQAVDRCVESGSRTTGEEEGICKIVDAAKFFPSGYGSVSTSGTPCYPQGRGEERLGNS